MIHDKADLLLAAGAVLDDLAPDERASYEAHRSACAECRRVELELDHVLADLAYVVPERVPPADLLGGIRRALAAEARAPGARQVAVMPGFAAAADANVAPAVVPGSNVIPLRRPSRLPSSRLPMVASLALAAGLAAVALGLGARTLDLQRGLDATNAQVASLEGALTSGAGAMSVAMNPRHVTVALRAEALAPAAEAAVVFVPGAAESWIVVNHLPASPAGHSYQLWYADAAGVHPLQTVGWDGNGTFVAPIGVDLASSAAVMITLEADGGAQGEPGPQVVFGEL